MPRFNMVDGVGHVPPWSVHSQLLCSGEKFVERVLCCHRAIVSTRHLFLSDGVTELQQSLWSLPYQYRNVVAVRSDKPQVKVGLSKYCGTPNVYEVLKILNTFTGAGCDDGLSTWRRAVGYVEKRNAS